MPEALQKSSRPLPGVASANRRRLACAALLAATIPLGLVWRLAPLGLPQFAFKYGGSALWAMAVYWVIALLLPRWQPPALGLLTAVVAAAVEFFKLVRAPAVDAFRDTLAGKLLIGRYFTLGALAAYWLAIIAVTALDLSLRPGRRVS